MLSKRIGLALVVAALTACGSDPGPPGVLEIGFRASAGDLDAGVDAGTEGVFAVVGGMDVIPIVLGANGLNMIVPSLRAQEIDPRAPDPTIEVTIGGVVMAADIDGARADMVDNGDGFVLWDIRVPFQTNLCCYNCAEATIDARIVDLGGRNFEGSVTVVLERGGCPDTTACCQSADQCPVSTVEPQICE